MKFLTALILGFGLSGAANGLRNTKLRHNDLMALRGLYPDGTPMHPDVKTDSEKDKRLTKRAEAPSLPTETIALPLDHWDSDAGTFKNRYWVSMLDYKPGGPVFVYDGGEGNAEDSVDYRLLDEDSFFRQMVAKYNGIGILWEHRFYGASTPIKIDIKTPASAFKYLTTEQALADVPAFAWNFSRPAFPKQDLTPKGTPWIFVGGSYPGMRAAFLRDQYPGTIFASYASSAPVQASVDMSFYFEPIWQGLQAYGFGNCSRDIQAAIRGIDQLLENADSAKTIKYRFLGKGAENNSNEGFADALTTIFYNWQSYGMGGGATADLGSFCNHMSTDPVTKNASPAEGWAPTRGIEYVIRQWITWKRWADTANYFMSTRCEGPPEGKGANFTWLEHSDAAAKITAKGCELDLPINDPDMISWTWQYCTQWGFLQYSNAGDHQLVSKFNNQKHQMDWCDRQFPGAITQGLLPAVPKAEATNRELGGWYIRPSQTFWTGGQFDPWRTLSPLSDMPFVPKFKFTQEVPECAAPPKPGTYEPEPESEDVALFSYHMPGAQHCYDFRTSFPAATPARDLWNKALDKWLPCFKAGYNGAGYNSAASRRVPYFTRRAAYP